MDDKQQRTCAQQNTAFTLNMQWTKRTSVLFVHIWGSGRTETDWKENNLEQYELTVSKLWFACKMVLVLEPLCEKHSWKLFKPFLVTCLSLQYKIIVIIHSNRRVKVWFTGMLTFSINNQWWTPDHRYHSQRGIGHRVFPVSYLTGAVREEDNISADKEIGRLGSCKVCDSQMTNVCVFMFY